MEWTEIICTLITAAAGLACAYLAREVTKKNKKEEQRDKLRKREAAVSLEMISATMELSLACCNALTGGHNNGNVEEAKTKALKADQKYRELEREILAEVLQ